MKISEINLLEIEQYFRSRPYWGSHPFVQYSSLIENTEIGKKVIATLSDDLRIQELSNKPIFKGNGVDQVEVKTLGMWLLWFAEKVGVYKAEIALNDFLNQQEIQLINCLWVLGIKVTQEIELFDGVKLVPIEQMLDSDDKERFLKMRFDTHYSSSVPETALVCLCSCPKVLASTDELGLQEEFNKTNQKLFDIVQIINLLPGIWCWPSYLTTYTDDSIPFGPFSGSGGNGFLYDVMGRSNKNITDIPIQEFKDMYDAYVKLPLKEKQRWQRILDRLSQSKRRIQVEDRILDLGISLEMMLLNDLEKNDQLSLAYRMRGSWLISKSDNERIINYDILNEIYGYRSAVAHQGVLDFNDYQKVDFNFDKYQEVAEKIGKYLLLYGKPNWKKVILGGESK